MNKRSFSRGWVIWGLAAAFFLTEYFARVAPSVMVTDLMQAFQVSAFSLGSLSAYFYYAYVGMQIPVGTLIDRYGPHRLLALTAAICGIGCFLFAHTTHLQTAQLGRLLMGFGASFAFVGALKLAFSWFPANRFGLLSGSTQALGMLGAAIGVGPLAAVNAALGWRNTMEAIGAILLLLALLIGLIVRDKPVTAMNSLPANAERSSLWSNLYEVLKNPQTWWNGVCVGFLYAPTQAFAELWGPSYLHIVHQITPIIAASAISMIFLGWTVGGPLGGAISDRIHRRKPVLHASILLSGIFLSIVLYVPQMPVYLLFITLFLYGMSNVGVATNYAIACEINPKKVAGTSMSFANMASVLIGTAFQPIIGALLDLGWKHIYVNGARFYDAHTYQLAMLALPACFIVSLLMSLCIRESYPCSNRDEVAKCDATTQATH